MRSAVLRQLLRKRASFSTASAAVKTLNEQNISQAYRAFPRKENFVAETRRVQSLKDILSASNTTAQHQHSHLPEELFKLIRKVTMEKNPDFQWLLKVNGLHANESESKLLESSEGVKFMIPTDINADLRSENWWGWNDKAVQESLDEGTGFLLDIPAANTARFLFLTKLKKRILVRIFRCEYVFLMKEIIL